jgi:hypothetical protein
MAGNLQAATLDACHVAGQVMKLDTEGFEQLIPPLERGFLEANAASQLKPSKTVFAMADEETHLDDGIQWPTEEARSGAIRRCQQSLFLA